MGKARYNWWPFALNIIHDYQQRKQDYEQLHTSRVTTDLSDLPGGGSGSRTTENIVLRELPPQEQREYDAVTRAMEMQHTMSKPQIRRKVVQMTLIRDTHTIVGAAMRLNIPESEAKRYRWEFIMLVGCAYGFLTPEECRRKIKEASSHLRAPKA